MINNVRKIKYIMLLKIIVKWGFVCIFQKVKDELKGVI